MGINDLNITVGDNPGQKAVIEENEHMIDYTVYGNLSYVDILLITKGLSILLIFLIMI